MRASVRTRNDPFDSSTPKPSVAAIAARAYELYWEDGCVHERDGEHWQRAESELMQATHGPSSRAAASRRSRP